MTSRTALFVLIFGAIAASDTAAQPVVALHAVPRVGNSGTCEGLSDLSCSSYSTEVPDAGEDGTFVYMVIARGNEQTGVSGISWDPDTNCQQDVIGADAVHAVAGGFAVVPTRPTTWGRMKSLFGS